MKGKRLPWGYVEIGRWGLKQGTARDILFLGAAALLTLFVSLVAVSFVLRLATGSYEVTIEGQAFIIGLMAGSALGIVLHELLHGVFFLAFGARPRFGFKPWTRFGPVFYASAPGSYLTKTEYAAAGLAPLALLTMLLLVCAALAPPGGLILSAVLWAYLLNAVGSIGDMLLMRKMVSYPVGTWFEDTGDGFVAYGPGSGRGAP